jgi:hypothetical protein
MEVIIPVRNHGKFTESDRATVELFLRKEAFPQFYTNEVFTSLEFEGVQLVEENLIIRQGEGASQIIRAEGLNPKYDDIKTDINENGWRLYEKPLFVTREKIGGKFKLLDGVTKDKILAEKKFKNRICVVVKIDEREEREYGNRLNAGEDSSPAGLIKEVDIISLVNHHIREKFIEIDVDEIKQLIDKICGKGKFSAKRRSDLSWQIFHQQNAIVSSSLLPRAWANNEDVNSWLTRTNYIETPTVIYLPYAASASMKAVFAAAKLSQQKPGKEVRVVIYVSKLSGYDLKKCYLEAVLKFKEQWYEYMDLLGTTYYNGAQPSNLRVVLYGCVPCNIEDVCEDMDKLIVFGKNDQKINNSYLMGQNLVSFFNMNGEEDE